MSLSFIVTYVGKTIINHPPNHHKWVLCTIIAMKLRQSGRERADMASFQRHSKGEPQLIKEFLNAPAVHSSASGVTLDQYHFFFLPT